MEHPPSQRPRLPRHLLLRFLLLLAIVGGGFAVLRWTPLADQLSEAAILRTFERLRESWWAPAALVAGYVLLCPLGVPATPLLIAGGVVFGTLQGWTWSFLGTFLAAAVTYLLGLVLGRDFVAHLLGRRLKRVERAIARRGFWSLVGARFMPLPFVLVNYGAALAGVPFGLFLATTALGLAPITLFFTYFAASLSAAAGPERSGVMVELILAALLLLALSMAPHVWTTFRRRKRYRELRERRGERKRE
ncbi:MAG: TVP38/TMEM64 family protein [Thermoanaerobaculia bacterium]